MSELLRGTDAQQRRVLLGTGAVLVAVALVLAIVAAAWPARPPTGTMEIVLSTPSVGQGIDTNSKVLLRGVPVGTITAVDRRSGRWDLRIRLNSNTAYGLTDSMRFDFRPQNTFGVSAVNVTPREGGTPLADGQRIDRTPDINATLSQLLSGGVTLVNTVITDKLVRLINNAADYTNALAPLIETGFVLANLIAETQSDTSAALLGKANTILAPLPDLIDTILTATHGIRYMKNWQLPTDHFEVPDQSIELFATGFWGPVGEVLGKHRVDFTPTIEIARSFADSVSWIVQHSRGSLRLDKLLTGLNETYTGPDGKKSVNLRLVLEPLPVLESMLPPLSDLDGNGAR